MGHHDREYRCFVQRSVSLATTLAGLPESSGLGPELIPSDKHYARLLGQRSASEVCTDTTARRTTPMALDVLFRHPDERLCDRICSEGQDHV